MAEKGNILVIDDEQSMCQFMEIMLEREGYDVVAYTSATEAIERIKSHSDDYYDLVITDLMMPEMSGIEAMQEIKSLKPEIDFIIMTAFGSVESAIKALKKGPPSILPNHLKSMK